MCVWGLISHTGLDYCIYFIYNIRFIQFIYGFIYGDRCPSLVLPTRDCGLARIGLLAFSRIYLAISVTAECTRGIKRIFLYKVYSLVHGVTCVKSTPAGLSVAA